MFLRQVYFYLCRRFHIEFFKTASSVELHFSIALQITNIILGTKTVWRTAKKSCGESSPEVPGGPRRSPEFPSKLSPQI